MTLILHSATNQEQYNSYDTSAINLIASFVLGYCINQYW